MSYTFRHMKWICILHFYQPPYQKPKILEQIVNECYLPLIEKLIKSNAPIHIYCNVNQSLIEQLILNNHIKVIENLKTLIRQGKIRMVLTPAYHPIIPLIPKQVAIEQITQNIFMLNEQFSIKTFDAFFPPELAFNTKQILPILDNIPIVLSQSALNQDTYIPLVKEGDSRYLIRHTNISNMIMGGQIRSFNKVNLDEMVGGANLFVTAVDAETFGHHRKGYEKVFIDLLNQMPTTWIPTNITRYIESSINQKSSWSKLNQSNNPFILWKDSDNLLHQKLWKLLKLAEMTSDNTNNKTDYYKATASCTFWWASANPWWSLEIIERGAWQMYKSIALHNSAMKDKAYKSYTDIVLLAFKWQREGKIDKQYDNKLAKRVPFADRCKQGELKEYISKFKKAENNAIKDKNYELAIKWRDAITKLQNKTDMFDDWHIVDELRQYE